MPKNHQGFQKGNKLGQKFQKGHLTSEEVRKKISRGNKGKIISEETKRKLSQAGKGRIISEKTKRKIGLANKGRKLSEEARKKMSLAKIGKKLSEDHRKKLSEVMKREKCHWWRGGITPKNLKIRMGIEFRLWRESVFARDNWTCQKYGIKGGKLHPHHIQNFSQYPELRFAIDNGITFSDKAHREFHKKYGIKNNNKGQIEEFLLNKKQK